MSRCSVLPRPHVPNQHGALEEVALAHGEVFAAVWPAATAVIVVGLLDLAWLVEIEAEATLPG
jgi:hypothetical protein